MTYLITFPNVFDQAIFKNKIDSFFFDKSKFVTVPVLTSYSSKFCIITLTGFSNDYIRILKLDFPGIKIILKQKRKNRLLYTTL